MKKLLGKVLNGNYTIALFEDGSKIRYNDLDELIPDKPESLDVKITNRCDKSCSFCLKPTAKLNVKGDKAVNIVDVNIGDEILSYTIKSSELEFKHVLKKYEREYNGDIIQIYLNETDILECTPNHKLYTQRGYVRADELTETDMLLFN